VVVNSVVANSVDSEETTSAEVNSVVATSVETTSVVGSPAGPFVKEDSIVTSAGLIRYLVTTAGIMPIAAAPTVTNTRLTAPTATTIAIDERGPMGEADVGLTHQADGYAPGSRRGAALL
jgi:hypothetical protein